MINKILFFFVIHLSVIYLHAQVVFNEKPENYQLYPRDNYNHATVSISGFANGINNITFKTEKTDENANVTTNENTVTVFNNQFSFNQIINSEFSEYKFSYKTNLNSTYLVIADHIVSGDVFLIAGQSNAVSSLDGTWGTWEGFQQDASFSNKYCRSFGKNFSFPSAYNIAQNRWGLPTSIWDANAFVGAWGLKMQYLLATKYKIPICIINGAAGGSNISQNLPSSITGSNPATNIYDRLYVYATEAKVRSKVKAIFWYQGESDYNNGTNYLNIFNILYNNWMIDYPSTSKIFVFQINTGCSDFEIGLVREKLREIPKYFPNCILMSTVGSNTNERLSDECHYTLLGRNILADKITPLIDKYLYSAIYNENEITPPNLEYAYYSNPSTIELVFNQNITWQNPIGTKNLLNYFFDENYNKITISNYSISGNKISLEISSNPHPQRITYLPNMYYNISDGVSLYVGPWIMNINNKIGALSFYKIPICNQWFDESIETSSNQLQLFSEIKSGNYNQVFFVRALDGKLHNIYETSFNNYETSWLNGSAPSVKQGTGMGINPLNNDLFYVSNSNNKVYRMYYTTNGWQYEKIDNSTNNVRADSRIIYSQGNIFYVREDGKIHNIYKVNGNWVTNWLNSSAPTVKVGIGMTIAPDWNCPIYYQGVDNKIYKIYWNGSIWYYETVYNTTVDVRIDSELHYGNGQIFFIKSDGTLQVLYKNSAQNWTIDWLNGTAPKVKSGTDFALSTNGGINTIYYIGTDSFIYELSWSSQNGWQYQKISPTPLIQGRDNVDVCFGNGKIYYGGIDTKVHSLYYLENNKVGINGDKKNESLVLDNFSKEKFQIDEGSFDIYPNPAANEINIELKLTAPAIIKIEIMNIFGNEIKTFFSGDVDEYRFLRKFNVSDLEDGCYFVKITTNNNTFLRKIIIQK